MVFAGLEPLPDTRADYHAALVASVIANSNRDPKKKTSPYDLDDFMLFRERRQPNATDTAAKAARVFGLAEGAE